MRKTMNYGSTITVAICGRTQTEKLSFRHFLTSTDKHSNGRHRKSEKGMMDIAQGLIANIMTEGICIPAHCDHPVHRARPDRPQLLSGVWVWTCSCPHWAVRISTVEMIGQGWHVD